MYKVKFRTAADRGTQEIIAGTTVVKEYVDGKGGYVGTLNWNGTPLSAEDMGMTFAELATKLGTPADAEILLFDAPKTANA